VTSFEIFLNYYYLSTCLSCLLRFDVMLYSNLGNENSDAGPIKCSVFTRVAGSPPLVYDINNLGLRSRS